MTATVAKWWTPLPDHTVRCELCPRHCLIHDGASGFCAVRVNHGGTLYASSYGHPVSVAVDPIEKKPLSQFMPGTRTFSFGTFGCNLGCSFCQNFELSRGHYRDGESYENVTPEQMVELAVHYGCPSISYTYNEPTVFAEYMLDIASLARQRGLKNVLVSNGTCSPDAAREIYPLMDAANIDMKGFSNDFYQQLCSSELAPVLDNLRLLYSLGVHLEITTLVIPGKNDDDEQMMNWLDWLKDNLDTAVPLHFSAYHPAYKCHIPPTPPATLYHLRKLAAEYGFSNVFLGNIF